MLKYLDSFFEYKSNVYITSLCLIFICVLGILDQLNGYEMSFSIFYILPISIVSWYAERKSGFILCYFSAVISLVVDYTSGHSYSDQSIRIEVFGDLHEFGSLEKTVTLAALEEKV